VAHDPSRAIYPGQVTNMSGMFCRASSFDGDVSCWGDHPEVVRSLFSIPDYKLRLLKRKANAPRFQARAQKNRNLMRNSVRLRQVLSVKCNGVCQPSLILSVFLHSLLFCISSLRGMVKFSNSAVVSCVLRTGDRACS
jgi:hypothetical protein